MANTEETGKWDHEAVSLKRACEEVFDDIDLEELVVRVCACVHVCVHAWGEGVLVVAVWLSASYASSF